MSQERRDEPDIDDREEGELEEPEGPKAGGRERAEEVADMLKEEEAAE